MPKIEPGTYQHFKGEKYRVIAVVKHSETLEDMVLYEALYHNKKSSLWVRPASMFFDEKEVDGQTVYRFKKITDQ